MLYITERNSLHYDSLVKRGTRVFLLLNHLKIFSCMLLISNHMIPLVQFGINKHLCIFKRPQIALALWAPAILLVFEKLNFTCANLFQIALEIK